MSQIKNVMREIKTGVQLNQGDKTMAPLISIIMPTYNRVSYIEEALDSIKKQTFTDYENTKESVAFI